jgi:hypothetical protein
MGFRLLAKREPLIERGRLTRGGCRVPCHRHESGQASIAEVLALEEGHTLDVRGKEPLRARFQR